MALQKYIFEGMIQYFAGQHHRLIKFKHTGNFELVFNASAVGDKKPQNLERKLKT